ncbi:DMT family transporter [Adlercreutzia equolifaciens]|uniref:DMT family transporter n=1 Tax=Adlercreutzia equolifaciens TaxID=446660 RepID=UPI0023B07593|nr:DMT family transporter [Adlercreutzia equolifaciens]MDE8702932.1 DMT family transporter [Adlercreutzia equolifaciens]
MRYHLIALFTVFVWGITFVSTKVLLADFSPFWILLLRFAVGFLGLCALRPRILTLKERRHELLFVAAGATGVAAYFLMENIALQWATATAVGVIVAAAPLFTALFQVILGDRSALNARFFLGFVVAMMGLFAVGLGSTGTVTLLCLDAASVLGYLLALGAAVVWAIYSLLVKRIGDLGYETVAATKRIFLWGLVFIVPVTLLFGGSIPAASSFANPANTANLLFLGAVASAACFVTWGAAVKHLGATTTTAYIYLVPAITATASILILGEPLNALIVSGIALTIVGLALSQSKKTKRASVRRPTV